MSWNMSSALYHKFDRVWGRSTIDGIQVYDPILIYWDGTVRSDVPFKRFINALGVEYNTLTSASYKGVENVYFKLDPGKYNYTAPEKAAIVIDLNSVFTVGQEFELFVHYTGTQTRVVNGHFVLKSPELDPTKFESYTIDPVAIRSTLTSDPMRYFANAIAAPTGIPITQSSLAAAGVATLMEHTTTRFTQTTSAPLTVVEYDADIHHLYSTLALLDNGSMFVQQGTVYDEMFNMTIGSSDLANYEYSYKIKYKVMTPAIVTSYIVTQIDILTNTLAFAIGSLQGNLYVIANRAIDTRLKEAAIAMNNVEAVGLVYQGRLRVDAVAAMKRKEFAKMLGKIFGSDYTKQKTKWYEKVLAIVIIIIAIVVFYFTGGVGAAISGNLVALAVSLSLASMVLTVGMMLYAAAFPYATDQTRMIGRWAQIVGYAAAITGIMGAIQQSWKTYVLAEAAKQGGGVATEASLASAQANASIGGYLKFQFQQWMGGLTSSFSSFFDAISSPTQWGKSLSSITMNDVSGWLKTFDTAMKNYMKFFGDKVEGLTKSEDEQAIKEDGVEAFYATMAMVDEMDVLVKMDFMIRGNNGGEQTERFLTKIV